MSRLGSPARFTVTPQDQAQLSDYISALAWSPDGAWLAAASAAGEVCLQPHPAGDRASVLLKSADGQAISAIAFAADGAYLAAAGQAGTLTVWQLQPPNFAVAMQETFPGLWLDQLAWHPQRPELALGVGASVQRWQVETGQPLAAFDFQASSVLHLAWHPQGEALAVSGHGAVKVWNPEHSEAAPEWVRVPGASLFAAWSTDGRYLASGNLDRTLTVLEWGHPPPWYMQGFPGKVRQLSWSAPPQAQASPLLAAACVEGITVWARPGDRDGWQSRVLEGHQGVVEAIAFQPGSQLLASAARDGHVCLWQQGQRLMTPLKDLNAAASTLAWHPTGDWLAAGSATGEVCRWRLSRRGQGFGE